MFILIKKIGNIAILLSVFAFLALSSPKNLQAQPIIEGFTINQLVEISKDFSKVGREQEALNILSLVFSFLSGKENNFYNSSNNIVYTANSYQPINNPTNNVLVGTYSTGTSSSSNDDRDYDSDVDLDTESATSIDKDSAKLKGEIDLKNLDYAYVWFEYGTDDDDLDEKTDREKYTKDDDFSETINDLKSGRKYYFRAIAKDDNGDYAKGNIKSFETDSNDNDVDVETRSATNISDDDADLEAKIDFGSSNYVYIWFMYGRDDDDLDDKTDRKKVYDNESRYYEKRINGLNDDTKYYFRAYIEDEDGNEEKGSIENFRTDD